MGLREIRSDSNDSCEHVTEQWSSIQIGEYLD